MGGGVDGERSARRTQWPGVILCAAATLALSGPLCAQAPATYQSSPERRVVAERDWGPWLGPFRARLVPSLMRDFGERYLYQPANRLLPPPGPGEQRVVFLGDSITDRWDLARSFPGRPYVNRGIGSQVTAQMLLRFHQDVIALRPRAVVILAGVNDVQGFLQQEAPEQIEANWEAMADLAEAHGIKVVFGSLLPVNDYTPNASDVVRERNPAMLRGLNDWLRSFCARRGYGYADYHAALVDRRGLLDARYTDDGIHPLAAGYARMAPVAARVIAATLAAPFRHGRARGTMRSHSVGVAADGARAQARVPPRMDGTGMDGTGMVNLPSIPLAPLTGAATRPRDGGHERDDRRSNHEHVEAGGASRRPCSPPSGILHRASRGTD